MSLQWTLVALWLYAEVFVLFLLMVPWISPSRWQKVFKSSLLRALEGRSHICFNVAIVILFLLFLDSIREVRRYSFENVSVDATEHVMADVTIHMKLFRAQRNYYIAGTALLLWMVIRKVVKLISTEAQLLADSEAAMKQAKSATDAAQALMERLEGDSQGSGGGDGNIASKDAGEVKKLKEALKAAESDRDAMKKQATSLSEEYDRLADTYSKLQKDFDKAKGLQGSDKKSD